MTAPTLLKTKPLKPGDRVAVISPAGPVIPQNLEAGLQILRDWQLEPVLSQTLYDRHPTHGYLAGDDHARADALHNAFEDPSIAAILCSRGGYGTMRLLPLLDPHIIRNNPKPFVGFSDITALHLYFAGILGLPTLHAPVVKSLPLHQNDPFHSLQHLHNALFGTYTRPQEIPYLTCVQPGNARGRLYGGNLSLIASMLSTDYCPDLTNTILVLEEIGEVDYRLDRLFTTLRLSPKSQNLAGIILGDFTDCNGVYIDAPNLPTFVNQLASQFNCPIVANFPTGHASRNITLPIGHEAIIHATHQAPNTSSVTLSTTQHITSQKP